MKSGLVSWLSLKTKVEPVQGSVSQLKSTRGVWLVFPQNQHRAWMMWRPSHEWDWRGGCTESAGFAAVHDKSIEVPRLSHKAKTENSMDRDGIWARREISKRRTCVGIARLASR
jgi:hypothetical protein